MPFEIHPEFTTPDDETVICKYMNFYKFSSLINRSQLFFCRSDKFDDPMEGCYPRWVYEYNIQDWEKHCSKELDLNPAQQKNKAEQIYLMLRNFHFPNRKNNFVLSFCKSDHEYEALWKLYSDLSTGICLKTNILKLKSSLLSTKEGINIGSVDYYSEKNPQSYLNKPLFENFFRPYLLKRDEYKTENEVRALYHRGFLKEDGGKISDSEAGVFIDVNLSELIQEIVLSPNSTKDFEKEITQMIKHLGLSIPIKKSDLHKPPF